MSNTNQPDLILSIIVVSYNTEKITLQTLESAIADLKHSNLFEKTEIFVVDNNSQDNSVETVKKYFEQNKITHTIIANQDNKGFASANNQAILKAKGKYILLLNSDTIVQSGALKTLIKTFEDHPIEEKTAHSQSHKDKIDRLGIIAPMLLNKDLTIQAQGGNFPTFCSLTNHMLFLDNLPIIGKLLPSTQHTGKNTKMKKEESKLTSIEWLGGTAMLIRKKVIDEIGLLDEAIFMYGEDIEYCLRAKNHHWDIAIEPKARIIHLANQSAGSENAYLGEIKGYLYLWSKYKPIWQIPLIKLILKIGMFLRIVVFSSIAYDRNKAQIYARILKKI